MRHFIPTILAILVTIFCIVSVSVSAQGSNPNQKSICVPIKFNKSTIDPNHIPAGYLPNMTLLNDKGTYHLGVSLCSTHLMRACGSVPGYIAIASSNGTCIGAFNAVKSRPTPTSTGFSVVYGSTLSKSNNDVVSLQVVCNLKAPRALVSRSHKFMATPYKTGGLNYRMIVYSSAACTVAPPGPTPRPSNATCKRFVLGRKIINPASWGPVALNLAVGFQTNVNWMFSLCSANPNPMPSAVPADNCPNAGYLTRFNSSGCRRGAFDTMDGFKLYPNNQLLFKYESIAVESHTNYTYQAYVSVGCKKGATSLQSMNGMYSRTIVNKTHINLFFKLGHNDMCVAITPGNRTTMPPRTLIPPRTRPTHFTRPTGIVPPNWTHPVWTHHPGNWTRGNHSWTFNPSHHNGNWTHVSHQGNWTHWPLPTGHHNFTRFPHPTPVVDPTRPPVVTRPHFTRPHVTLPTRPHVTRPTPIVEPTRPQFSRRPPETVIPPPPRMTGSNSSGIRPAPRQH